MPSSTQETELETGWDAGITVLTWDSLGQTRSYAYSCPIHCFQKTLKNSLTYNTVSNPKLFTDYFSKVCKAYHVLAALFLEASGTCYLKVKPHSVLQRRQLLLTERKTTGMLLAVIKMSLFNICEAKISPLFGSYLQNLENCIKNRLQKGYFLISKTNTWVGDQNYVQKLHRFTKGILPPKFLLIPTGFTGVPKNDYIADICLPWVFSSHP